MRDNQVGQLCALGKGLLTVPDHHLPHAPRNVFKVYLFQHFSRDQNGKMVLKFFGLFFGLAWCFLKISKCFAAMRTLLLKFFVILCFGEFKRNENSAFLQ